LGRQLLQHWVCLHFLLNQITQLEQRRLEGQKALLDLWRENLLKGKVLRLMHSWPGHTPNLPAQPATSKAIRASNLEWQAYRLREFAVAADTAASTATYPDIGLTHLPFPISRSSPESGGQSCRSLS